MTFPGVVFAFAALALDQPGVPHIRAAEVAYEAGKQAQIERQWQRAAEAFRKATEIEPTFLEARENLIAVYLDLGQRLDAAAAITQLLEIEPAAQKYRLLLGQILLEQKQPERALAQFSLLLKRDPYNADGLLGFATAARQVGMNDRADEAMERGKQHYPGDDRFKSPPAAARRSAK
jgi:tetratricopeptide (TPR) repeat protein